MEYRHFGQAKAMSDAATTAEARKRLPDSALIKLVQRIEFDLAQEEIESSHG